MKARFIGDVHGKRDQLYAIARASQEPCIQVGDLGIGFVDWPNWPGNLWFLRGNHDRPEAHDPDAFWQTAVGSSFLPTGIQYENDLPHNLFVINGATSIDQHARTEGVNWWREENHTTRELWHAGAEFLNSDASVIVSHTCPTSIAERIIGQPVRYPCPTAQFLELLWRESIRTKCAPTLWVFGHWHKSFDEIVEGTRFVCLAELEHKVFDVSSRYGEPT